MNSPHLKVQNHGHHKIELTELEKLPDAMVLDGYISRTNHNAENQEQFAEGGVSSMPRVLTVRSTHGGMETDLTGTRKQEATASSETAPEKKDHGEPSNMWAAGNKVVWDCSECGDGPYGAWQNSCQNCGHCKCKSCSNYLVR